MRNPTVSEALLKSAVQVGIPGPPPASERLMQALLAAHRAGKALRVKAPAGRQVPSTIRSILKVRGLLKKYTYHTKTVEGGYTAVWLTNGAAAPATQKGANQ